MGAATAAAIVMPRSTTAVVRKSGLARVGKNLPLKAFRPGPPIIQYKLTPEQVAAIGPEPETTKA